MFFIEDKNFLSKSSIDFIENKINQSYFPFYYQKHSIPGDEKGLLTHTVLNRLEDRKDDEYENSEFYPNIVYMLNEFCAKNNLRIFDYLRACVNMTYPNGYEKCDIHQDHEYPHLQLLIYLNEVKDKNSKTIILDDDKKTILKEITPEKYKGVCFENKPHFHYYPKIGERLVAVYTFTIRND